MPDETSDQTPDDETPESPASELGPDYETHVEPGGVVVHERVTSDYGDRTVADLQDVLRARGLATSGTKDELVARLEDDDAERSAG